MFRIALLVCCLAMAAEAAAPPRPVGALVIVGGGGRPASIEKKFIELAGGAQKGNLVVIPTASSSADDKDAAEQFLSGWASSKIERRLLHTRDRDQAQSATFVNPLKTATAVWFSGGDQAKLTKVYAKTRIEDELRAVLARGGVVGGTSAGAAVMSSVMLTGGTREAKTAEGFGLLPGVIVDQHFLRRDRVDRLMDALRKHPGNIGIGIDEATAIVVRGDKLEVVGESYVVLIVPASKDRPLSIRVLRHGDRANLADLRR
jgi:cyanophycinase